MVVIDGMFDERPAMLATVPQGQVARDGQRVTAEGSPEVAISARRERPCP